MHGALSKPWQFPRSAAQDKLTAFLRILDASIDEALAIAEVDARGLRHGRIVVVGPLKSTSILCFTTQINQLPFEGVERDR
jgi:hypothetical protein